jgi:hypothetical protein
VNPEEITASFFQKNNFGWIPMDDGGHILGITDQDGSRALTLTGCVQHEDKWMSWKLQFCSMDISIKQTTTDICAFLLFGDYEAILDEHGKPIFMEAIESTKKEMEPHYMAFPGFRELQESTKSSVRKAKKFLQEGGDGEGWKD